MREFVITIEKSTNKNNKEYTEFINNFATVVFDSGKYAAGCIISGNSTHSVYGWGKHSDAVRMHSAIRNNGYKIISSEGV